MQTLMFVRPREDGHGCESILITAIEVIPRNVLEISSRVP